MRLSKDSAKWQVCRFRSSHKFKRPSHPPPSGAWRASWCTVHKRWGDSGRDKSLSASPWVNDHTRGHRQSLFEALPVHLQGPALWPYYKSAYTHAWSFLFFSSFLNPVFLPLLLFVIVFCFRVIALRKNIFWKILIIKGPLRLRTICAVINILSVLCFILYF